MRAGPVLLLLVATSFAGCLGSDDADKVADPQVPPLPPVVPWNFTLVTVDVPFKVNEPSIEVGPDGSIWITGPTGFTRGATGADPTVYTHDHGLFVSHDGGDTWQANTPIPTYGRDACPGGGDSDLAIAPDGAMFLADLSLATVPIGVSTDGGDTWLFNCHSSTVPVMDRQWVEASDKYVWVMANQLPAGPMLWRAERTGLPTDGLVFQPPAVVPLSGPIERDPTSGALYLAGGRASIAVSTDDGQTWQTRSTGNEYGSRGPFQNVAVDNASNVFHAGAGNDGVWLVGSRDKGEDWSPPALIRPYEGEYMFAWAAAKDDGVVAVAWYGRPAEEGPLGGPEGWYLYAAQSSSVLDGDANATLTVSRVTPEPVTTKQICAGLGCDSLDPSRTRALGDFFETAFDKEGRFIITYNRVGDDGKPILMFAREEK